nr:hypothetical protein [Tanacetum cinerariifolium]
MLKGFDREDLAALWNLVKEKFSSADPSEDKEKALWVKLKRLFERDADDVLWKLQRYMHAPLTWKLYSDCEDLDLFKFRPTNRNTSNHIMYHALIEALIEDKNAMDNGVADKVKDHKRNHDDDEDDDDDEDPLAVPNQGKKTKRGRTKESDSYKKPSTTKETPKGKAPFKGSKTGKSAFTKEPVKEPTAEVVMDDAGEDVVCDDDQPQDTFEPKTVKTSNLKWLDWTNPEGDRYPFDLSEPLLLQGHPCHLTVAVDYSFNNNLEYLKYFEPERMYIMSIMKIEATRYKVEGIEDIVHTLWSTTQVGYDKDTLKWIKH